jgi:hypothetical protein
MDIKLNFINHSNDTNNSQIVIFQKNATTDVGDLVVARQVIRNCGPGDSHPFVFPLATAVGASDADGNRSPQQAAENGELFSMVLAPSGNQLTPAGPANDPAEAQVRNGLSQGAIPNGIYKSGKLLARKAEVAPGQKAVFQFKPTIWIGAVSQVEEGEVMNSAILSSVNTELSLLGIASADIVMTGGGSGVSATPFEFSLQNVVMA